MEIRKVAVVGMGTMGSQIGVVCARGGFETRMIDISPRQVERGMKGIKAFLAGQVRKAKMDDEAAEKVIALIKAGTDFGEAVADVDLIVEAVYENIDAKKEIFKRIDEAAQSEAILASNTSTLWII